MFERSLLLIIIGMLLVWVVLDELYGDKKVITRMVKGMFGEHVATTPSTAEKVIEKVIGK